MKIVVLAGGISTERDVSLTSGTMICNVLRERGHQAILVDVFLGCPDAPENLEDLFVMDGTMLEKPEILATEPDIPAVKASRADQSDCYFGPHVLELAQMADICFLGLHGDAGENGQVQAALDLAGARYTGAGYVASALAMNKDVTKAMFQIYGVPTPRGRILKYEEKDMSPDELGFSLPVVAKVPDGGSSIGVYIIKTEEEFHQVIGEMMARGEKVLLEEFIKGREFACGVLDGKALPAIEIIPKGEWFDYAHKYQSGYTREVCPADIPEKIEMKMRKAAELAYEALGMEVYGRLDILLTEDGSIYCLEVNSLPGMTPASLLPKEAAAAGIEYGDLCEKIIADSLKKYA